MKKIIEIIKADLYRYDGEENLIKGYLRNRGFRYTLFLRITGNTKGIFYLFFKFILRNMMIKYGYEISEKTNIGKGLAIMHLNGIAINSDAQIGENVTIYHRVTIGGDQGKRKGAPNIGNMVWIGPNSVIVGKIKIGNNVLITGNAFINFDIPDNSLVIGNPPVIKKFESINEYIQYVK